MGEIEQGTAEESGAPASRRRFIELAGGGGGAAALSILAAACGDSDEGGGDSVTAPGESEEVIPAGEPGTDLEIIKFALFLEYFEETFYGEVLESGQVKDRGLRRLLGDVYHDEQEHAQALTALVRQLAGTPVPRPKTKFGPVIDAGEDKILETAALFENLGAAAYLGQADKIQNSRIFEAALSIHTVEARHAAALNEAAGIGFRAGKLEGSVPDGAFAKPMTREEVLAEAARFVKT